MTLRLLPTRLPSAAWSALDVMTQRGAAAVAVLVLAALTDPEIVGVVSIATLLLTLYQALFEAPVRQSGYRAISGGRVGIAAVRRLALFGGIAGSLVLALAISSVLLMLSSPANQFVLVFYALVPAIVSWYLPGLLIEQHSGRWPSVAVRRIVSVCVGVCLGGSVLLFGEPILAIVVLTCSAELVFAVLTYVTAKRTDELDLGHDEYRSSVYRRDLFSTCALSVFGWLRGQLDRVSIVSIAGPAVLGSFTLAYAVARAPADAAMAGMSNLFRSELASGAQSSDDFQRLFARHYIRLVAVGTACFLFATASAFALSLVLDDHEWGSSLSVVPLLASSVYTSAFVWSINALLNHVGLAKRVYVIQWLEIGLSVLVGCVMVQSFTLGVLALLGREFVGACLTYCVARRFVSFATVVRLACASIGSLAVSGVLWFVLGT